MPSPNGYPIVTLCGSTQFKTEFLEAAKAEELRGYIVLMPNCFTHYDGITLNSTTKKDLDAMHLEKILMSDEILVINVRNYVGISTKQEIEFATKHGKNVRYIEPLR